MGSSASGLVTIFLAGDVMTGRGIDQIMAHQSAPELREPYVKSARTYVELAEGVHGAIPTAVAPAYVWGDAPAILERFAPSASIVNLETSMTLERAFWPEKEIHYRMHPENIGLLERAGLDVCTLANNHVLDFGRPGLIETLESLERARIQAPGAGRDLAEASRPARVRLKNGSNLWVFAFGHESSGIPADWAATPTRSGIHLLRDLSARTAEAIVAEIRRYKAPDDLVIASIHWGHNWGYEIAPEHRAFAHALIDGGADVVHGHSSHHARSIELYANKLILYGCGDLVTDYEGIDGHEAWRGDLGAMYFATLDPRGGDLVRLELVPTQMRKFSLRRAEPADARWLRDTLNRISRSFGVAFETDREGDLVFRPGEDGARPH